MLGTLYSKRNVLEIAERRGRVRALVTPPIYVNLDNSNGGLVFNISEDGLALTAALDLGDGGFLTMRILLPDSEGWIETSGEIAWRGKSKKEGGVRFVGLAAEARRRISNWIAGEASRGEFQEKNDAEAGFIGVAEDTRQKIKNWTASETPRGEFQVEKDTSARLQARKQDVRQRLRDWIFQEASRREFGLTKDEPFEKEKRIVDIASVHASRSSIHESENRVPIVEKEKQDAIVPANLDTHVGGAALDVGKLDLRHTQAVPNKMRDARGAQGVLERRAQARTLITPPVYVNLGNTNGGLAFNMSENGIALSAALALAGNHTMSLRIQIPDSKGWVEVSGRLAWRGGSGKTAGIKFIDMPEDSQQRIRDWLAAEASGNKLREEERMLAKSEQHSSDDGPAEITLVPLPAILNANRVVEKRMLEALLSGDRSASIDTPGKVSISRQEPQRELPEDAFKLPSSSAEQVEILENSKLKVFDSGEVPSLGAVQEDRRASALPELTASGMRGDKLPDTVDTLDAVHLRLLERRKIRKSRRAFHRTVSGTRTRKLGRLAAVVTLAGATAAGIGWIAAQPAVRNEVTTFVTQNIQSTNKPAELETTRPSNEKANDPVVRSKNIRSQSHELEPVPAHGQATDSVTRTAPPHPQARDIGRPAANSTANGAAHRTESSLLKSQPAKAFERTVVAAPIPAVESTRNQVVESSPAPPTERSPVPAKNPSASVASGATLSEVKEKESPPPVPEQPAAAVAPVWSVAVSADPYPSIRMPQDKSSQKASSTRSLQIGRVISRVEPIYPEEAKQQGTEGAVRLHVVVGRDGSVQSVTPISGQASLAKAAVSAVGEWRYAQTLLGGQPVETEQDILVKFRVAGPSISKN
jgi:TonB family protein